MSSNPPATRHTAETFSTSRADDAAYRALKDVATIAATAGEMLFVGGQMVTLLLATFRVSGSIERRTADADVGMSPEIAVSGIVHEQLIADQHPAHDIGQWKLLDRRLSGSRLDAARTLHQLATEARRNRTVAEALVEAKKLTVLIRKHVARPEL